MGEAKHILFKEFIVLQRGFDLPKKKMSGGPYPVVGSTSILGYHNEYKVEPPGVITGRSGSLGFVQYVSERYWPHNTALWVRDFKGNLPRYVYYYLQTLDLNRFNSGAGVPTLNRNDLDTLEVAIPPIPIQHKIAAILSAYDDLIENSTRRMRILEETAQMIYQDWFVNFRFPGHESVRMVESELGLIPEGWMVKRVDDVSTLHRGKSYRSADLVDEGGLPFLNLKCIDRGGGFRYDGIKRFRGEFKDSQTAKPGDIIIAVTDMTQERRLVAHAARVPDISERVAVMSMDLVRVDSNENIPTEYLYGMFRFSDFSDAVKQHANGVNVLHLNPERIGEFKFILATEDLTARYATICTDLYQLCDTLHIKNNDCRRTRDLLLPRLISGEIDVENLDIDTEVPA
ncbi:MAG: hypothetical protein AMJ75_05795 [Phycisphaerae bacterium SM1_79]|nr:MAG: hypothetical protein AMJ75_05795 [Phycisphaerae bacterium SM1_79]